MNEKTKQAVKMVGEAICATAMFVGLFLALVYWTPNQMSAEYDWAKMELEGK